MREFDWIHVDWVGRRVLIAVCAVLAVVVWCVAGGFRANAQENPLGQVKTPAPVEKHAEAPGSVTPTDVTKAGTILPRSSIPRLRMEANLVLVPMTVTDGMNRLVTGL